MADFGKKKKKGWVTMMQNLASFQEYLLSRQGGQEVNPLSRILQEGLEQQYRKSENSFAGGCKQGA